MTLRADQVSPRVLVTGGAGYIGSHAVLALGDAGYRVTVLDDLSTGFRSAIPDGVDFVEADVGDEAVLADILRPGSFDVVMHFAAALIVPESVADPLKYYGNNSCKTGTLLAAVLKAGIDKFIFSSTAAVYGIPQALPASESVPPNPINPYGSSKLIIEWMLKDVATAHGLRYTALRYFNVAGADPLGRAGQSTAEATHLIKVVVEHIAGRREAIEIFGTDFDTPDGTGIRDYIHVSDLADLHVLALQRLIAGGDSIVANCGYGHGFSVRQVIEMAELVGGKRLNVRCLPRRVGDPAALVADASLAKRELQWRPRFDDLETIIRHALAWETRSGSQQASDAARI